eukprot:scaffold37281_cov260-Amphora_coffeaeformis.AAC.1
MCQHNHKLRRDDQTYRQLAVVGAAAAAAAVVEMDSYHALWEELASAAVAATGLVVGTDRRAAGEEGQSWTAYAVAVEFELDVAVVAERVVVVVVVVAAAAAQTAVEPAAVVEAAAAVAAIVAVAVAVGAVAATVAEPAVAATRSGYVAVAMHPESMHLVFVVEIAPAAECLPNFHCLGRECFDLETGGSVVVSSSSAGD